MNFSDNGFKVVSTCRIPWRHSSLIPGHFEDWILCNVLLVFVDFIFKMELSLIHTLQRIVDEFFWLGYRMFGNPPSLQKSKWLTQWYCMYLRRFYFNVHYLRYILSLYYLLNSSISKTWAITGRNLNWDLDIPLRLWLWNLLIKNLYVMLKLIYGCFTQLIN